MVISISDPFFVKSDRLLGHCRNDRKCKLPAVYDCDGMAQTVSITMSLRFEAVLAHFNQGGAGGFEGFS
jgi:hypothetical protein